MISAMLHAMSESPLSLLPHSIRALANSNKNCAFILSELEYTFSIE